MPRSHAQRRDARLAIAACASFATVVPAGAHSARARRVVRVLEWPGAGGAPRRADPLMGWTSSGDTRQQVKLRFDTRELAIAYAEREGLAYTVAPEPPPTRPPPMSGCASNGKAFAAFMLPP